MPHLLLFGLCQKVLVDPQDLSISMIGLVNGITLKAPPGQTVSEVPLPWAAVSTWVFMPEDEGKTWEQRIIIVSPSGKTEVLRTDLAFKMAGRTHQNFVVGDGFPCSDQGDYQIQLWLREIEEDKEWEFIREYPFEVQYVSSEEGTP